MPDPPNSHHLAQDYMRRHRYPSVASRYQVAHRQQVQSYQNNMCQQPRADATKWHMQLPCGIRKSPSAAQGDQKAKAGRRLGSHVTKDKGKPPAAPQSLSRCSHNKQPRVAADLPPSGTTLLEMMKVVSEGRLPSGPAQATRGGQELPPSGRRSQAVQSCREVQAT